MAEWTTFGCDGVSWRSLETTNYGVRWALSYVSLGKRKIYARYFYVRRINILDLCNKNQILIKIQFWCLPISSAPPPPPRLSLSPLRKLSRPSGSNRKSTILNPYLSKGKDPTYTTQNCRYLDLIHLTKIRSVKDKSMIDITICYSFL